MLQRWIRWHAVSNFCLQVLYKISYDSAKFLFCNLCGNYGSWPTENTTNSSDLSMFQVTLYYEATGDGMVQSKVRVQCSIYNSLCRTSPYGVYALHMGFLYWKPFKPQLSLMRKLFLFTVYPYAIRTRAFLLSSVDILQAQYAGIMQRTVSQSINQNKLYRAGPIASSVAWQGGE